MKLLKAGKSVAMAATILGVMALVQVPAFAAYNEYSISSPGTVYQQVSDIDSNGNSYSWMQAIGGKNNYNGTITINYINWYGGKSSPASLYYGPSSLVDSVNSSNTVYLNQQSQSPYGWALSGTDYYTTSSFSWTGNSKSGYYAYLRTDVGKSGGFYSNSPNVTGTSNSVLIPR